MSMNGIKNPNMFEKQKKIKITLRLLLKSFYTDH